MKSPRIYDGGDAIAQDYIQSRTVKGYSGSVPVSRDEIKLDVRAGFHGEPVISLEQFRDTVVAADSSCGGHRSSILSLDRAKQMSKLTARQRHLMPDIQAKLRRQGNALKRIKREWNAMGLPFKGPTVPMMRASYDEAVKRAFSHIKDIRMEFTPEMHAMLHSSFCEVMCAEWGSPMWMLDDQCADALMRTELPFDTLTEELLTGPLRLPFPAFYIQLSPSLYNLYDPVTENHAIDGIYVAQSWSVDKAFLKRMNHDQQEGHADWWTRTVNEGKVVDKITPGIVIAAVGCAKGTFKGDVNDTCASADCGVGDTVDPAKLPPDIRQSGIVPSMQLVYNFLLALNANYLNVYDVRERPAPRKAKKRRMAERRGEIFEAYRKVSLRPSPPTGVRSRPSTGPTGRRPLTSAHAVKGHWRSYWVLPENLGDRTAMGTKLREDGTALTRIVHWIHPFICGPGKAAGPCYKVVR